MQRPLPEQLEETILRGHAKMLDLVHGVMHKPPVPPPLVLGELDREWRLYIKQSIADMSDVEEFCFAPTKQRAVEKFLTASRIAAGWTAEDLSLYVQEVKP